jgi:hypothetical protein
MNRLDLQWLDTPMEEGTLVRALAIRIDGRSLIDLVRDIEAPFPQAQGDADLAGSYAWLPEWHHLAAEFQNPSVDAGTKTTLLGCTCGEPGCWPLLAKITPHDDVVVWSEFEQPYRDGTGGRSAWRYEAFGPFVFARDQYDAELAKLRATLRTGSSR